MYGDTNSDYVSSWHVFLVLLVCVIVIVGGGLFIEGCESAPTIPTQPPVPDPGPEEPPPGDHNEYKDQVLMELWQLHNMARAAADPRLGQLRPHTKLDQAAQKHAEWMAKNNKMSHTGAGGSSFWDRVQAEGFRGRGGGENIAYGYSTAKTVMNGWMNSSGHRANILRSTFTHLGLGYARADNGRIYWCTTFGYGGTDVGAREDVKAELFEPDGISAPEEIEIQGVKLQREDGADNWVYAGTEVPAFFMEVGDSRMLAETNEIRADGKVYRYDPWEKKWLETDIDPKTLELTPEGQPVPPVQGPALPPVKFERPTPEAPAFNNPSRPAPKLEGGETP